MYCTGEEAKKIFADATELLNEIVDNKSIRANAIIGFYPACAVGDDIHVYMDDLMPRPEDPAAVFYGLRQQVKLLYFFVVVDILR